MDSSTRPLLITSINPGSNLEFQIECFDRWKAIGFEARSINVAEEADKLRTAGVADNDIRVIDTRDSGLSLFSKPVPRVKPLLDSLVKEASHEVYVIANSDLFPAMRSSSVVKFWESRSTALALTREECHALEAYSFTDQSAYRGGLDAFFMTSSALTAVTRQLSDLAGSERMAFGIPGWDYLMGACVISDSVGGAIIDSRFLLHVSHRPSYGNMNEFEYYLPAMASMGQVSTDNAVKAARQFAHRIESECKNREIASSFGKLAYFTPARLANQSNADAGAWRESFNGLIRIAPQFESQYRTVVIRTLANRLIASSEEPLQTALSLLVSSQSMLFRFTQTLFAIAFSLRCKQSTTQLRIVDTYPEGNQHKAALQNIVERYIESDPNRRLAIAILFGSELINYGIFNPRLYDYLVLCCENDTEQSLLADIYSLSQGMPNAA